MPPFSMSADKSKDFKKSIKYLFKAFKPYRWAVAIALTISMLGTVLSIVGPLLLNRMMELLFAENGIDFPLLTKLGIALVAMYVVSFTFTYLEGFIMAKVSAKIAENFRRQITQKINHLPLSYFDKHMYGDVLSRMTNDVSLISQTLNDTLSNLINSFTMIIGIPIMMFTISWELTLFSLIEIPLALIVIFLIVKFSQKYFVRQQKFLGDMNSHIEEIYSAHNVVKAFNGEAKAISEFDVVNKDLRTSAKRSRYLSSLMMPSIDVVGNLIYAGVCVFGAYLAISTNNLLFITSILTFITYIKLFHQPMAQLGSVFSSLQSSAAASERVMEFLDEKDEPADTQDKRIKKVKGKVEFDHVSFGYSPDKIIIHDFSFTAEPGQNIAIVGPTGAGKTTLVNLLMRFYEIGSGDIRIDGVSIKDMKRSYVRSLFGMVLQDTWLFEGTIRENLKFGNPTATDEQMIEDCKMANVHHFITTLPGNYDMILKEDSMVSQGQRQLLTIARAMIQDSPMLILDEATSSVDTRTEVLIQTAMERLTQGRTSFVIAHRLSTIRNADQIIVMNNGDIVEVGDHDELMAKQGFYFQLYSSQFDDQENKAGKRK